MSSLYSCILIVDDDETSNYISEYVIKNAGIAHHTHTAANGKEALDFLHTQYTSPDTGAVCPDFIILDVNMPVMDGFQFLEQFGKLPNERTRSIKIMMLTSSSNPRDTETAKKYAIQGYINKPLTEENLLAALNNK